MSLLYNPTLRLGPVPCLSQWVEISHCLSWALFFHLSHEANNALKIWASSSFGVWNKETIEQRHGHPIKHATQVSNNVCCHELLGDLDTVHSILTYTDADWGSLVTGEDKIQIQICWLQSPCSFHYFILSSLKFLIILMKFIFMLRKKIYSKTIVLVVDQKWKLLIHVWLFCDHMDCSPPGSSGPWNYPGKTTWVGSHSLLQGVFLTQG